MSIASRLLVLALATSTLTAAAPRLAEACGPYGMTPEKLAALKLEKAERKRLAKIRSKRAKRCVVTSLQKKTAKEREAMSHLPLDAKQRRSVAHHYPLFSEDNYRMSVYMDGITLARYGATWEQLNETVPFTGGGTLALRPAGNDEWMVVHNFKAECPQPKDISRTHLEHIELP